MTTLEIVEELKCSDVKSNPNKRMELMVQYLKRYIDTYDNQYHYQNYSDTILIDDILYGLGVALNPEEHQFADGFDTFKNKLIEHLTKTPKCPIITSYSIKPMDYETKIQNGHKFIVGHFFKPHEIQVGSRWIGSGGGVVTVEGLNSYGSTNPWYKVVYFWHENGEKKTHDKDVFSFQCRYCLIVEDT